MFTGRFEVSIHVAGGKKELIHAKKNNEGHGLARKPQERQAICERIQEELNMREAQQQ
jgi:hypothetical protein